MTRKTDVRAAPDAWRPTLYVLAGVNGAGKSSLGGEHLAELGIPREEWINPDEAARKLLAQGVPAEEANSQAWTHGRDVLRHAIDARLPHAFETTLGGNTIPALILEAAKTHAVRIWFCGLASPELHLQRVRERVAAGGHDIPERKIRERWTSSRENLIRLMPHLAELTVFDNSAGVLPDGTLPDPRPVLHVRDGEVLFPEAAKLASTPEWAMPIVEAALTLGRRD